MKDRPSRSAGVIVAAVATAVLAACVPPKPPTPPPGNSHVSVVVGGTVEEPLPGGRVVLRDGSPVSSAAVPTGNIPASALSRAALDTLLSAAPLRTSDPAAAPLRTSPIADLPLRTSSAPPVLLSTVPLTDGRRWTDLLAGTPLEGSPPQSVTLNEVVALAADGDAPQLAALVLADLDLTASPLRTSSVASIAMGNATLDDLPGQTPPESDPYATTWCPWIDASGLDCSDFSGSSTIMALDIARAPLRTSPLRTSPLRTSDLSASPLRTSPLRTSDLTVSPLRTSPLRTSVLGAATLSAVALVDVPLRTSDLSPSPLRTSPLRTSSPALLDTVIDCGRPEVDCGASSTQTLGDVASLEPTAIRPAATVADYLAAFPTSVTDPFQLGDLKAYGDATIGDIQATVPLDVTVADAILAVIPRASLQWESVPYDELALPSLGATPPVAVTVHFDLTAGRTKSATAVKVQLPPEVFHVPGNSRLVNRPGSPAFSVATGGIEPSTAGSTLTFAVPSTAPAGSYALGFHVSAAEPLSSDMRVSTVRAFAGDTGATTVPATFDVVDSAGGFYPDTVLGDGDLFLGAITEPTELDTFVVPVPPVPGAVTEVSISHLGADLDLVAHQPTVRSPVSTRSFRANGLKTPPAQSTDPELVGIRPTLDPQTQQDLRLLDTDPAMVSAYSARRGTADERVQLVTRPGDQGEYRFQVSGYNGATSSRPYLVVVRQSVPGGAGECTRPAPVAAPAASIGSITGTTRSLFLVNRQRMVDTYGQAAFDAMAARLQQVADHPGVAGAIVSVDGNPAVRAAYAGWDAAACDPDRANQVVGAIDGLVDDLVAPFTATAPWGELTSITIVGGDDMIPMARVADGSAESNQSTYAAEVQRLDAAGNPAGASPMSAAFATRHVLTDDAYASWDPIAWRDSVLFLPDIGLGRLVEKPSEISVALDAYLANPTGRLSVGTALTTGYDFLSDGAESVDAKLPTPAEARQLLVSDTWSADDLTDRLYGGTASPHLASVNAHFDHHALLPAEADARGDQSDLVTTVDVAANPGRLAGRLIFSMGCHSGLSVPDGYLTGSPTTPDEPAGTEPVPGETAAQERARLGRLDWAEAFANDGAVYIGNTGFGYGDTATVAFSERLMTELAALLDGTVTAGDALAYAKQAYYGSLAAFSDYDQKVLHEATFYGLPFWGVGDPATPPAPPAPVATEVDPATGLSVASAGVTPSFSTEPTPGGTVIAADGEAPTVVDGQPIVARTSIDVTPADPNLELHGYVITGLTSEDTTGFASAFGKPVIDLTANEPATPSRDAAFPSTLQATSILKTPTGRRQVVNLNVSQFTGGATPGVGTSRRFTAVEGDALYSPASSTDGLAPTVWSSVAASSDTNTTFVVEAADVVPGAAPGTTDPGSIVRVAVMYRDGAGWHPVELAQVDTAGGREVWSASAPPSSTDVDWFAQVVDAAGNVSVSSNKARLFSAVPNAAPLVEVVPFEPFDIFLRNQDVGVNGSYDDPDGRAPYTGTIDWGDGTTNLFIPGEGTAANFLEGHQYTVAGTYVATFTVCDALGSCGSDDVEIFVAGTPVVGTFAGNQFGLGSADGTGSSASFARPRGLDFDSLGNLFVADSANHTIRKVTPSGVVTTFAGTAGVIGSDDGTGAAASFSSPRDVAVDSNDNVYVADLENHTIRKITPGGVVTTLAGTAGMTGSDDGPGAIATFFQPSGIAVDASNTLYVTDRGNHTVREISPLGVVTTLAGSPGVPGAADGTGSGAMLQNPEAVAVGGGGTIYIADNSSMIRTITSGGVVTTWAGSPTLSGWVDGVGTAARFTTPTGLAVDAAGNVYVADLNNHLIRRISPAAEVTTLAGIPAEVGNNNGPASGSRFWFPYGVAVDATGNVYVGDTFNNMIRKITI